MRKFATARVSYQDDFLISYRVYMMTGSFHISLFEGTTVHYMLIKYTCDSKSQTLRMHNPLQSTGRPISHRNGWSIYVYMILLRDFMKFSPRYNNRGELTPGWLAPAWNFVVVWCKQIYSHEREPEGTCAGAKVAPVSCKHLIRGYQWG